MNRKRYILAFHHCWNDFSRLWELGVKKTLILGTNNDDNIVIYQIGVIDGISCCLLSEFSFFVCYFTICLISKRKSRGVEHEVDFQCEVASPFHSEHILRSWRKCETRSSSSFLYYTTKCRERIDNFIFLFENSFFPQLWKQQTKLS